MILTDYRIKHARTTMVKKFTCLVGQKVLSCRVYIWRHWGRWKPSFGIRPIQMRSLGRKIGLKTAVACLPSDFCTRQNVGIAETNSSSCRVLSPLCRRIWTNGKVVELKPPPPPLPICLQQSWHFYGTRVHPKIRIGIIACKCIFGTFQQVWI